MDDANADAEIVNRKSIKKAAKRRTMRNSHTNQHITQADSGKEKRSVVSQTKRKIIDEL